MSARPGHFGNCCCVPKAVACAQPRKPLVRAPKEKGVDPEPHNKQQDALYSSYVYNMSSFRLG